MKIKPTKSHADKLDSVARDAKDILARVRTNNKSIDSPSFYIQEWGNSCDGKPKLDSSALQDRAKELSLRIKAMREGRVSSKPLCFNKCLL